MILITSNMTAIPSQLYEAAIIDGANAGSSSPDYAALVLFQTMPILILQFRGNINNFGAVFFLRPEDPKLSDTIQTQAGATDPAHLVDLQAHVQYAEYVQSRVGSLDLVFIVLVPFAVYNFSRDKSFKDGEL
jgi:arabinogalactan oligomer/maltooligosaccharide transport system permease protein